MTDLMSGCADWGGTLENECVIWGYQGWNGPKPEEDTDGGWGGGGCKTKRCIAKEKLRRRFRLGVEENEEEVMYREAMDPGKDW